MGSALRTLGYSVIGARGSRDPNIAINAFKIVEELGPQYDAFQDNPWAILYEYLDQKYPGSKFILTVRDSESWLKSAVSYFGNTSTPMREWIYGYGNPIGHEREWVQRYERHNREVRGYFGKRMGTDFLEMDLTRGHGWQQLCPFLGIPLVRDIPFPRRNSREQNRRLRKGARRVWKGVRRRIVPN